MFGLTFNFLKKDNKFDKARQVGQNNHYDNHYIGGVSFFIAN